MRNSLSLSQSPATGRAQGSHIQRHGNLCFVFSCFHGGRIISSHHIYPSHLEGRPVNKPSMMQGQMLTPRNSPGLRDALLRMFAVQQTLL